MGYNENEPRVESVAERLRRAHDRETRNIRVQEDSIQDSMDRAFAFGARTIALQEAVKMAEIVGEVGQDAIIRNYADAFEHYLVNGVIHE